VDGGKPDVFADKFMHFWYCCCAVLTLFEDIATAPGLLSAADAGMFRDSVVRFWERYLSERVRNFDLKIRVLWVRWRSGNKRITDFESFMRNYPYSHLWNWSKAGEISTCCDCVKVLLSGDVRIVYSYEKYKEKLKRVFGLLTALKKGPRRLGYILASLMRLNLVIDYD
jgi:hypothetical protein